MARNRQGTFPYCAVSWTGSALLLLLLHIGPAMAQTCQPQGDVNDDGMITVADARLALLHYLAIATPPLTDCQQAQANVDRPMSSPITPADALCIFQQFLSLPSCFPAQPQVPDGTEIQFLINTSHPLALRLLNASGQPVTERLVTFQLTAGDGILSAAEMPTDPDGRATTTLTLGGTPGPHTVEARVIGLEPVVFRITGVSDARGSATVMGNTQQAPPGTVLDVPLVVRVEDEFGNPVAGVEVTVTVSGEGAEIAAATQMSMQSSLRTLQPAQINDNTTAVAETNAQGEASFRILGTVGMEDITAQVSVLDQTIAVPIVDDGILLSKPNNTSPLITFPDLTAAEGQTVSFQVTASDPDVDDELTFIGADNLPLGLSIDPSGSITGTLDPAAAQGSPYMGTVTVSDGTAMTSAPFIFTVTTLAPTAPVLEAIGAQTVAEGSTQSVVVRATDANLNDILTLSTSVLPDFITLNVTGNGTGTLLLAPDFDDMGTYSVTLTVTDSGSPSLMASVTFTITVNSVNRIPVATNDIMTTNEDQAVDINVLSNDSDLNNDVLTVASVTQGTKGAVVINANGTVRYTPAPDSNGLDSFMYTVSDNNGGTATATVNITVTAINDAPTVTNPGNQDNNEGDEVSLQIMASDPDEDDSLTFRASDLPPGLNIDQSTGLISGTIGSTAAAGSPYTVTITVSDNIETSEVMFTWNVDVPSGNVEGSVIHFETRLGIEGVQLDFIDDSGQTVGQAQSDENGVYVLELPAGMIRGIASLEGFIQTNVDFEVIADILTTAPVIELVPDTSILPGNISGTIINAITGEGVEGVLVGLRLDINNTTDEFQASTRTGSDGSYAFSNLQAGTYTAHLSRERFLPNTFTVGVISGENNDGQDSIISPQLNPGEVRIVLTWGEIPVDLDAHLRGPRPSETPALGSAESICLPDASTFHLFWPCSERTVASGMIGPNPNPEDIPFPGTFTLDIDNRDDSGPETITLPRVNRGVGVYRFCVHHFPNESSSDSNTLTKSEALVRVFIGGDNELIREDFHVPPMRMGTEWAVFELDSETNLITRIDSFTSPPLTSAFPFSADVCSFPSIE